MKLLDLYISGFGKIQDRSFNFADGLNVIYGKNEAGKSTLHTFIQSMFFGLTRGRGRAARTDTWSRYEPWNTSSGYGGSLRLEQNGTIYRLERDFRKDPKALTIIDETRGKELEPTRELMEQLLCGLTETSYANTVSIGQLKSATDGGMVSELKNYIANMNTSGNMALNITKATNFLKKQKKNFEQQMVPEAALSYTSLLGKIRNLEKEIASPEYENQLSACLTMRGQVRSQLDEKQEEREALLQKLASARQVLAANQFTDVESITAYEKETKDIYSTYLNNLEACRNGTRMFWTVGMFLFALAGTGVTLLSALPATRDISWLKSLTGMFTESGLPGFAFTGAAAICTLIVTIFGVILAFRSRECKKNLEYSNKLLQEIFTRHLGDPSISETALEAFLTRMEEFVRLSESLKKTESTALEHMAKITGLQQKQSSCDELIERQQRIQWELEKKLEQLISCKDQVEALKPVLEENERLREEINAIELALETMTRLSSSIRDSFGLYLNKEASDLISGITGGIYNSMSVDENLNIFMNTRQKLVPIEQVSSGTMDQVYLALRLATARLVQTGHDQMPLIFDDSFALYDDERLHTALRWLSQSYDRQIIIFTCHQREARTMTANQIKYHHINV